MPASGAAGRWEAGQAAVETVALIPVFVLVALAMGQGAVAGYTAWSAAGAARVGARSQALGDDPAPAVRAELPSFLVQGAHVRMASENAKAAGRVTVRLRVPSIVPGLTFGSVSGRALLPSQVDA